MVSRALSLLFAVLPLAFATSPAQIYIYPPPLPNTLSVDPKEANAILSHHLGISQFENSPKAAGWVDALGLETNSLDDLIKEETERDNLLIILVHGDNVPQPPPPFSSNPSLTIASPPPSTTFDALFTTYLTRLARTFGIQDPEDRIFGFRQFVRDSVKGLGEMMEEVGEMVGEWIHTGEKFLHLKGEDVSPQVEPPRTFKPLLDILDFADESASAFVKELQNMDDFVESLISGQKKQVQHDGFEVENLNSVPSISALRFQGLQDIALKHGQSSDQFKGASQIFSQTLEAATSAFTKTSDGKSAKMIYVQVPQQSTPFHLLHRRSTDPISAFRTSARYLPSLQARQDSEDDAKVPKPIISSSSPCFESQDVCRNQTGDCSGGRGSCVKAIKAGLGARDDCWTCSCRSTVEDGKKKTWGGSTCQKEDLSGDFVLLAGSTIALILATFAAVMFLYYVGEVELPSQLASVGSGLKRS